jgi:hypothetical protein
VGAVVVRIPDPVSLEALDVIVNATMGYECVFAVTGVDVDTARSDAVWWFEKVCGSELENRFLLLYQSM